jgi:DNA-binding HxlR family transcriptional regulator
VGDRWSLLILRDIILHDRRHYTALLEHNPERISTSVLARQLAKLEAAGLLRAQRDRLHRQRVEYSLTETAIRLLPVMVQLAAWSVRCNGASADSRISRLERGGPALWARCMDALRAAHLLPRPLAGYRKRLPPMPCDFTEQSAGRDLPKADAGDFAVFRRDGEFRRAMHAGRGAFLRRAVDLLEAPVKAPLAGVAHGLAEAAVDFRDRRAEPQPAVDGDGQ